MRKLNLHAILGIGQYEKKLIGRPLLTNNQLSYIVACVWKLTYWNNFDITAGIVTALLLLLLEYVYFIIQKSRRVLICEKDFFRQEVEQLVILQNSMKDFREMFSQLANKQLDSYHFMIYQGLLELKKSGKFNEVQDVYST